MLNELDFCTDINIQKVPSWLLAALTEESRRQGITLRLMLLLAIQRGMTQRPL